YWPAGKPRFWATPYSDNSPFKQLLQMEGKTPAFANGLRYVQHLNGGNYKYGGFPTRARGGMIGSNSRPKVPPEIFPARFDRGIPWVFTEEVATSRYLTRDIEVRTGPGRGFLYCYTYLSPGGGMLEVPVPNFRGRESRVRVDGEWVVTPKPRNWSWPSRFFERDEFLYVHFNIGLS
ncbi:MAG: hypothetical protein MJE12_26020, partial [Alphaproteobacteria bacterium]|nr:hypothetical protein [Alphaproteobacteria bacterium]